jgi:hypothetical protein
MHVFLGGPALLLYVSKKLEVSWQDAKVLAVAELLIGWKEHDHPWTYVNYIVAAILLDKN